MNNLFIPGLSNLSRPVPQANCDYDFGGDGSKYITPFVYNYWKRLVQTRQGFSTPQEFQRGVPTDSANGVPCRNTKKALAENVAQFNTVGIFKPKLTYKETISTRKGKGYEGLPVDATLRNEKGDICMIFMFYREPVVTDWGQNLGNSKYWHMYKEISDRLLRSKCAYCIVDDGYSTMLVGLKPKVFTGLNTWDPNEKPLVIVPSQHGDPVTYFLNWWMLKALENAERHRDIFEKNVTNDWCLYDF